MLSLAKGHDKAVSATCCFSLLERPLLGGRPARSVPRSIGPWLSPWAETAPWNVSISLTFRVTEALVTKVAFQVPEASTVLVGSMKN